MKADFHPEPQRPRTERRRERIEETLKARFTDLTIVLANIFDPHNVSAVLRSCDAFGVMRAHLYYTYEAFPAVGRRASASAKKWVEVIRHKTPESLFERLAADLGPDALILGAGTSPGAIPVWEVDFDRPTAVIFGNEHKGLCPELCTRIEGFAHIPMFGMVESLNVSVAAAITLYQAAARRVRSGAGARLSAEQVAGLTEQWLEK